MLALQFLFEPLDFGGIVGISRPVFLFGSFHGYPLRPAKLTGLPASGSTLFFRELGIDDVVTTALLSWPAGPTLLARGRRRQSIADLLQVAGELP